MKRIGMGLVGPGFAGVNHVDAVRRLGYVDMVAVAERVKPAAAFEAFSTAPSGESSASKRFHVQSEDLATILVRFEGGAKGVVSVGQVCAGDKNDLWFEVNGRRASLRWRQEEQNELWSPYAHLPGGHQEGWSDAFCNVLRDIYEVIVGRRSREHRAATFATFQDGYEAACLVDAILDSHRRGGSWVDVRAVIHPAEAPGRRRIPEKAR